MGTLAEEFSVDLDVKDLSVGGLRVLPISVMKKKVLKAFDVMSASGETLSILTSGQTSQIAIAILRLGLEDEYLENSDEYLNFIVTYDAAVGDEVIEFNSLHKPAFHILYMYYKRLDKKDAQFAAEMMDLTLDLINGFLLIVQIPESAHTGTRSVLKFSYEDPLELQGLMRPKKIVAYLLTDWSKSFHLEVRTPQPIVIKELSIRNIDKYANSAIPVNKESAYDISGRQIAHAMLSGAKHDERFAAFILLRADTKGLPRTAFLAVFLTWLASNALFASWMPKFFDPLPSSVSAQYGGAGTSTTILLLAPSLLFAFLAKRSDHHIEARILTGPRIALLCSGLLMFGAAIANTHPISETVWRFPLPSILPIISNLILMVYVVWYLRATNTTAKIRKLRLLVRSTLVKFWGKIAERFHEVVYRGRVLRSKGGRDEEGS